MQPIKFDEANRPFKAGKTAEGLEYGHLDTWHGLREDHEGRKWPVFISKHKADKYEMLQFLLDPTFFVEIFSNGQPPISTHVFSPFMTFEEIQERSRTYDHLKSVFVAAAERIEQYSIHGHDPRDDFRHENGELIAGALAYISAASEYHEKSFFSLLEPEQYWPFDKESFKPYLKGEEDTTFKPKDKAANIRKAIGFLMAEHDRIVNSEPIANETETKSSEENPAGDSDSSTSPE